MEKIIRSTLCTLTKHTIGRVRQRTLTKQGSMTICLERDRKISQNARLSMRRGRRVDYWVNVAKENIYADCKHVRIVEWTYMHAATAIRTSKEVMKELPLKLP
jgi:hypothetical protein